MNLVLLPDAQFQDDAAIEQAILGPEARVEMFKASSIAAVPLELWQRCDAIMLWHVLPMDGRILDVMERCKVIVRAVTMTGLSSQK